MRRRTLLFGAAAAASAQQHKPRAVSGVYPHLAMFNEDNECGTGGVVPWAGRLWVVTYSPHRPAGSPDKLYEITEDLRQIVRPESIGGTPANRMIHRESNQLFLGPYAIDAGGGVRAIPYAKMYGRPTGTARHLTDPANKVYFASMEEGFYEVDVRTLALKQLYEDANLVEKRDPSAGHAGALLPGYHGKGLYTGQGRLIYANNGEYNTGGMPPSTPSGCLAEWDGREWRVVRRNQFTEVTGPGGLYGNSNPESDPVWSVGWDHRSLILMVRDAGAWHSYRLPKASHCYDGAHGWNTEWPRIRDIGEGSLLMTMHGMFWRFPKTLGAARSAGIAPRSAYIRVVGDFARWGDRIVLGCDDAAKAEFLNRRNCKGRIAGPGQSQSNLWFVEPRTLDALGPAIGRGGVWVSDEAAAGKPSEPFLFDGFERRMVHIAHGTGEPVKFTFEADARGDGQWTKLHEVATPAMGYAWHVFDRGQRGAWIRVRTDRDATAATVYFQCSNADRRPAQADPIFAGLAGTESRDYSGGLLWNRGEGRRTLLFAAREVVHGRASTPALYELADLQLKRVEDAALLHWVTTNLAVPVSTRSQPLVETDRASVIYYDEEGKRWRLPKGPAVFDAPGELGPARMAREASTERDLLLAHGSFYELPSNNAGGIAMLRPVCTHHRRIHDFTSHRGMLVLTGVEREALDAEHIVRSADGRAALWLGVVDDLWRFGKPRGTGGPWLESAVIGGIPSDPYLMTGYDRKLLRLRHAERAAVSFRVEADITGAGLWRSYRSFAVEPGDGVTHEFPEGYAAYWIRVVAARDCMASAVLDYS